MAKNDKYVSINKAAMLVDMSVITLKRWYQWYESPRYPVPEGVELPPYYIMDGRKTKHFKMSDIPKLKKFKKQLQTTHFGCMGRFNAERSWGKRGDNVKRSLWSERKSGEYMPRSKEDPTDISAEYDKKEQEKWEQEQAELMKQRQQKEG